MRKLLLYLLTGTLILSLFGCQSESPSPSQSYEKEETGTNNSFEIDFDEDALNEIINNITAEEETSEIETESEIIEETTEETEEESKTSVSEIIYQDEINCKGKINIYRKSDDLYLYSLGTNMDLNDLGSDEYISFSMQLENRTKEDFIWQTAYVKVDGGDEWHWASGSLPSMSSTNFRIFYENAIKCSTEGTHTAEWYFDGKLLFSETFNITKSMNWSEVFTFPTNQEISNHNSTSTHRSPYLAGWYMIPKGTRYTEYSVEFKADYVPKGTYCCLGNWTMDYSYLDSVYESYRTEYNGVHAYAGFQNIYNGETKAIMSFWDVFCTDETGHTTTIRAEKVYPSSINSAGFTGEGTGAQCIVPYSWEADHWYRMHLRCSTSDTTGNTIVEQWVCDLETGNYTLLVAYDIGVRNSAFLGEIAIFLENYLPEYSGEIRSMEVRNAMYLEESTNTWKLIDQIYLSSNGGMPNYDGSYNFGIIDGKIYMITSGVGGDWFGNGKGKQGDFYTIK